MLFIFGQARDLKAIGRLGLAHKSLVQRWNFRFFQTLLLLTSGFRDRHLVLLQSLSDLL